MDQEQERIEADLRGRIEGEVRCDAVFLQLYASDASIYQIPPLGVARPRTVADVIECVRYAEEHQVPLHARGAGSGLAGESLGAGLILDFSRHMRRILEIGPDFVRVQPGVVLERLNAALRPHGRLFGPDPANSSVTTMGSVVALDGSGSRWLKYGSARRHVRALQIILADGERMNVEREPLVNGQSQDPDPRKRDLINRLAALLSENAKLIADKQPKSLVNRSGYLLADVLSEDYFDFPKLLSGSEGTLTLTTEITLGTDPLPRHRGVALLFFDRLESAARAVHEILPLAPTTCDLLDRRYISLARETDSRFEPILPTQAEAVLLVESDGDDAAQVRDQLRLIIDRVRRRKRLAFDARQSTSNEETELFLDLPRRVVPTLHRLKGPTRALPFIEDIAVPPTVLPSFLVAMQNVLKRHQVTASLFGHAGHGQLHIRPFLDLHSPEHVRLMQALADDMYAAALEVGGTISGEHGDGLSRTSFLRRQYGDLYDVFRSVKQIFDPHGLLNPGKIITDVPDLLTRSLRPPPAALALAADGSQMNDAVIGAPLPTVAGPLAVIDLQLQWAPSEIERVTSACNGCGACRTAQPGTRMCPIFHFAPAEESSPRAKANLMRGVLTGQLPPSTIGADDFKAIADLCVNCKMCHLECPAGVDIPRLMLEAKAGYVAVKGLKFSDWLLTRFDLFSPVLSLMSPISNWALRNRAMRWLMDKFLGIAQERKLPRYTSKPFLGRAHHRHLTRPSRRVGRKVLYFVDTYANFHDPKLAEALVATFEHNGVAVYVHPAQTQSGMAMVSIGAMDAARKTAARNVAVLAEAVRQGYTIVASEPSAALCLTQEYPKLLDDDDTRLVAKNVVEACAYLWGMHLEGKLMLDLRRVNASVGYHTPCHVKALGASKSPGESLLRLIPGLSVHHIEQGCSGMAGTFGLKRENYRSSLRAGWGLISAMRSSEWHAGATECSACKLQMEQGVSKATIHPLKLLAHAYGMMPEIGSVLYSRREAAV